MMRILFMGTPQIAAACLEQLLLSGCQVVAAITREDKPRGRGNVMTPTPVKQLAQSHGIPVYTPQTLRDAAFAELLATIAPDVIVVVAYGKLLPPSVLSYPRYGCLNLHVSLLPKYRGAAPMQRAIMAGERQTGVTVMYMNEGLDTGDVIATESFPIGDEDDLEVVHDRSCEVGARLLVHTLEQMEAGQTKRTPQDEALATYAPKIEKEDCHIDFHAPAARIDPMIRGLTPIPGAFAYLGERKIKLVRARPRVQQHSAAPGTVLSLSDAGEGEILIACGEGALALHALIPEGKGRMSAADFIRGRKIKIGDVFS